MAIPTSIEMPWYLQDPEATSNALYGQGMGVYSNNNGAQGVQQAYSNTPLAISPAAQQVAPQQQAYVQSPSLQLQMPSSAQQYSYQSSYQPMQYTNTQVDRTIDAGSQESGSSDMVGSIFDMVSQVTNDLQSTANMFIQGSQVKEQKARWDKTFAENVRQFDLEFALKEFSLRKGLELQEVQQMFNIDLAKKNNNINALIAEANLNDAALTRRVNQYNFYKQIQDDKTKRSAANGVAKAMMQALSGAKPMTPKPQMPV